MKLGLISSAWLGTSIGTAQGIQLTKEIGFDTVDIFADPMEIDAAEHKRIREACIANQLPVVSTVCCALGIADFNQPVRRFHIERAKRYLDLACDLNGRNMLLVLGEYIWNREVIHPQDQWNWAVQGVKELGAYARQFDLGIALEIEPFELSIVNNIAKMNRFLNDVDMENVMANIDISHLALAGDAPERIQELAGRIGHVHLSDCDGKKHGDLPPGRGVVNFPPFLKALNTAGFEGTVSIELEYSPEPAKIVDWVREAYTSTSNLMSEMNVRS